MRTQIKPVVIPDFGVPTARPELPAGTYSLRCDKLVAQANCDWVVVYADREHLANIIFLTGFEPRFEEALLLLGRQGQRMIVTGNESSDYTSIAGLSGLETVLSQSMSLMGQDRSQRPRLEDVLRDCGISKGHSIGLVGWKYLAPEEWEGSMPGFFLPAFFIQVLIRITDSNAALRECTALLMDPTEGARSVVDADEIAVLEWGAARASAALWRIVKGIRPGESELEAAARMAYAGEPLSCHMMLASNDASGPVIGLRSPTGRRLSAGDGISAAVGYWGGLSARAGLLSDRDETFLAKAAGYFEGLVNWYETADLGVAGGDLYEAVEQALAQHTLAPALNPGHLLSIDEWPNTPVRRGSQHQLASGMPLQVDIIPVPMQDGQALNCEDAVVFADANLRAEIKQKHPQVYERIQTRRVFIKNKLGVELKSSILPLSSTPLCLAPFWLSPEYLLART